MNILQPNVSLAFRRDEESLSTNWYWLEIPWECWRGENGGKTSTPIKEDEVKSSGDHQFLHSHKSPRQHCDVEVFWCIVQTAVCICADNTSKDSQDLIFHWFGFLFRVSWGWRWRIHANSQRLPAQKKIRVHIMEEF